MAQNFLYMFEFVVDDLLVTRPNYCAPEEYPMCCEISFRSSVFLSICDREFGQCVDSCSTNCGKCCLFSLEAPITENDVLHIHVYQKKTDKCKFLVGCTDLPVKGLFDKVMENFNIENPNWQEIQEKHIQTLPNLKEPNKPTEIPDNDCDCDTDGRSEQLCPTSEMTKSLLPLFNLKGCQTGNLVLITRLVANGPTIVSTFPFARNCSAGCVKKSTNCQHKTNSKSCGGAHAIFDPVSNRSKGGNDSGVDGDGKRPTVSGCNGCGNNHDNVKVGGSKCGSNKQYKSFQIQNNGCIPLRDPCHKEVKKPICHRYFGCNADKGCPCDIVEDDCERSAKCNEHKQKLACCGVSKNCCPAETWANKNNRFNQTNCCDCEECMDQCEAVDEPYSIDTCDDCVRDPHTPCDQCIQPCFITPRRPDPGPEAYEEFEACLNGSGMVIRVLKDTHQVESICDGTEDFKDGNNGECNANAEKENLNNTECSFPNTLQHSNFARNHIKRRTGGYIINHPDLPKIRANIKYSGKDSCGTENYQVPYSKIKSYCDQQNNKLEAYRSQRTAENCGDSVPACMIKHRKDERNCCVQVNREDIRNVMKGLDVDTRKKGIEVCYKTCEDTDSDVFLVKLGSKQKCERKKNNIEIELKTPKQPLVLPKQYVTTETQINETELDAALLDVCKKKRGKGKKGGGGSNKK